jgi:rhodanese-related sulfurtransferase
LGFANCGYQKPAPDPEIAVKKEAIAVKKKTAKKSGQGKVVTISLTDGFTKHQSGESLFIDARPAYLFEQGHIAGAISIPRPTCDEAIEAQEQQLKAAIASKKSLVVYCTGFLCADARTVANHLADFGYSSSILEGGWDSWKASELPTE